MTDGVMMEDFLQVYEIALKLYKDNKLDEAWQCITFWEKKTGVYALLSMLLKAYILRQKKCYVSEVEMLGELLKLYGNDADKSRIADAYSLLGSSLRMLGESRLSMEAFLKSAETEPRAERKLPEVSNALFTANAIEDISATEFQAMYGMYRTLLEFAGVKAYLAPDWQHDKIRVGYISADWRNHAVGQFVRPLLFNYDTEHFEVFVYQLNKSCDVVTNDLQKSSVKWRDIAGFSFVDIAAQIRADEIDILMDLGGHTADNALPVLAYRPAKKQISGIGYFNSTGIYECDGFLSDVYCSSDSKSAYFTEKLLRLPHTHFCYQPYTTFPDVSNPPCLKNGFITFGSFNNFAKVNDVMLALWREILARVPNSRLVLKHMLLGTEEGLNYTKKRMSDLGMDLSRIEFRDYSADYLQQYNDIDIALDTSPYPGGLTTCEALYMGVPVVTLKGNRHGANFGYSFLANIGLEELAADTKEGYVNLAVGLSCDVQLLQELRKRLRGMMEESPLMDSAGYMKELEELYQEILR